MSNKSKKFMFCERAKLEYILNTNTHGGASKLAKVLGKSRSTIRKNSRKNMFVINKDGLT